MIAYGFLLFVVIGGITFQSDRVLDRRLQRALNRDLNEEVVEYAAGANSRPPGQRLEEFTAAYLQRHARPKGIVLVVQIEPAASAPAGSRATVLATPGAKALRASRRVTTWLNRPPTKTELADVSVKGANLRALASPIVVAGRVRGTLIAADDVDPLNRDRRSQLLVVGFEGAAALLAAIIGGYFLIRRILRVVAKVADTAEEITISGDLSRRLRFEGPNDEVGRLARTVDGMLERLETAFHDRTELLADVSHQLRTPLTIVRGHLDVLSRGGFTDPEEVFETVTLVIDELDQLALMVERMLLLGQALERDFVVDEAVDLRELLTEVFEASRFLGERRWELGSVPPVVIRGDPAKLRGALLNLIDNAVKATGVEDRISLEARVHGDLVLEVSDSGRGLAPEELSAALGRRVRASSPGYRGSGLGLAIVNAVAEAHGGRVELDSTPGHGCTARMVLPAERIVDRPVIAEVP